MDPIIQDLANRSEELYATRLKESLEKNHMHEFVAIEPDSGDCFLGKTESDAASAALDAYPDRLTHLMRVGHEAAVVIGCLPWLD